MGTFTDELVVWQLGEFRELRAAGDLRRIAAFSTQALGGRFGRMHEKLVTLAMEALFKIGELPTS